MWMLILVGLNVIANVHGYANGNFPQSCESMLPQHEGHEPQTSDPPFEVTCEHGNSPEEPVKVTLKGKESSTFIGFMLQARTESLDGEGPAVGKFTLLPHDTNLYRLLTCSGSEHSSVSHARNHVKTVVTVLWTPVETEKDIMFRATFLQDFYNFWQHVHVSLSQCTSPLKPTTATTTLHASSPPKPMTATATLHASSPPKPDTTEPMTATATLHASTTPKPDATKEQRLSTAMMIVDCVVEEVKGEGYNIITVMFSQMPFHHPLRKVGMIVCSSISILLHISTCTLLYLCECQRVPFIALLSVVAVINITELVIVLLPIDPSHELRDIRDHVLGGFFILHQIFAIAVIYVGAGDLKNDGGVINEISWILISALTVWIMVSNVWSVVIITQKRRIMQRSKRGKPKHSDGLESHRRKGSPDATKVIVISAVLFVGTICFAIPIMVALLNYQEK